jgi:hypothetical protein
MELTIDEAALTGYSVKMTAQGRAGRLTFDFVPTAATTARLTDLTGQWAEVTIRPVQRPLELKADDAAGEDVARVSPSVDPTTGEVDES